VLAQSEQPTITWISDVDGFWDVATNWRDGTGTARVPNTSDDVLIDRGSIRPVVTVRSSQSVHSVSGTAPLLIDGGSPGSGVAITIAANSKLDAGITLRNASLILNGPLVIAGNSNWQSGAILNNGGLTNAGTFTLSGTDTKYLGGVFNNAATISHEGGTLQIDFTPAGSLLYVGTLNNTGLYDIKSDVTVSHNAVDAAAMTNSGTIRKSGGTGSAMVNVPLTNNGGSIDSDSGTITLTNGTENGGTFSAGLNNNAAAIVQFTGTHTFTGAFTGSGKGVIELNGDTFTAGAAGATLNFPTGLLLWVSGVIDGANAGLRNAGSLILAQQTGARTLIQNRFDNSGTLVISGPSAMDIDGCATVTNVSGGLMDFQGDGFIRDGSLCAGSHTLVNNGTIRKSAGTVSNIGVSGFNNTGAGTIDVRAGSLILGNGRNTGGTFIVAAGTTLELAGGGTATYSGNYAGSGAGVISLASGVLIGDSATFNFPSALFLWTGGTISSNGASGLTNVGTITLSGATTKYLAGVLNNSGTILHKGGALQIGTLNAGTLNNMGLFDIQADVSIVQQFVLGNVINNTGVFRKSAGTGATSILAPFNNTGTLEVRSGSATVLTTQFSSNAPNGNTLTAGTWHVFSNSELDLINPLSPDSTVAVNKAAVILDGPGTAFPGVAPLTSNSGTFSLLNGAGFTTAGDLINSGSITLGAGSKLNVTGSYSQTAAGSLRIQIGGRPSTSQFGQLNSAGNTALAGTFSAALINGFGLTSGDTYTVMRFPSHAGSFATTATPGFHADLTNVALTVTAIGGQTDLSTTMVSIPTPTATPGQQVSIAYTVKNLGTAPATGDWYDAVYLSTSPFLGPNAVLLGNVHHTGDVAGLASYNETLAAPLPPTLPGAYYALVLADSRNLIPDANRANNLGVSSGTLAASISALVLGTSLTDTIVNNQDLYYHLVLPPGADVSISAKYSVTPEAELYIRLAALPDRATFDFSTLGDLSNPNPKLAENNTQGGDYYILLHGLNAAGGGQAFTLTAAVASFAITSIMPQAGLNTGTQNIVVTGTQFTPQTTISIVAASGTVYPATSVSFVDSTTLTASFDLRPIPLGSYTVRAANGSQTAIASTQFRVTNAAVGSFSSTAILSPAKVRVGSPIGVQVYIKGFSNSLTPVPLIQVDASNVATGQEHQQLVDPALPLFFQDHMEFGLIYDPEPHADGVTSTFNLSLISLAQTIDWDSQKERLRPSDVPADAWDAIWANLRPRLKSTVGDFYALLGQDAEALAENGVSTNRLNRLMRFEIAMANAQSPVPPAAASLDLAFPSPGIGLQFGRSFLGSSLVGRYHLGRLGRGWVDSLDIWVATDPATKQVVIQQGAIKRSFSPNADGSYEALPGESGTLTQIGGVYRLREKTGAVTVFRQDGSLDYVQDANNNRITAGYAGTHLTTITHSSGFVMTLSYDGQGHVHQVTDPAGRTATYSYDSTGQQLLSVTTPAGTVSYSYTAEIAGPHAFALASITTPGATHTFFSYDIQGRLQSVERDAGAEALKYSYDLASVRVTDANDRALTLFYDDSGRVVRILDPLGHQQIAKYDDSGNLIAVQPQGGGAVTFSYDSQANLTDSIDPIGASETSTYDPVFNQLTSRTDALGRLTTFSVDGNGNTISATYIDRSREQFSYDAQGQRVRTLDRNGNTTFLTYDKRGLLLNLRFADGSQVDYTYDLRANMTSATDSHGTISMQYDTADRLIHIAYPHGRFLSYSYDGAGRLVKTNDQTGFTINYGYDPVGRMSWLADGSGRAIVTYNYNAAGQVTQIGKGNGVSTNFEYDANGRFQHIINLSPDNSANSRFDYTYDALGRRDSATTLDGKTSFGYDADNRLISVTLPSGHVLKYVYDSAGNRIGVTDNNTPTAYDANNLNEYVTIGATSQSYDAAGQLLTMTGPGGSSSYSYDTRNRVSAVMNASGIYQYEYDALGHRCAVTRDGKRTEYLVDPGGNAVSEYDASGALVAHYTYGFSLISRVDSSGATAYYDFDVIGSTVGLTGSNGKYLNRYTYLPFGETISVMETIPNPFRYVGALGVQDDQNGLNFMRSRFYSPAQGRFTQPDPIGVAGGTNLYVYADNNPAEESDPSGVLPINPLATTFSPLATTIPGGEPAPILSPLAEPIPGLIVGSDGLLEWPWPPVAESAYVAVFRPGMNPLAVPVGSIGGIPQAEAQAALRAALVRIAVRSAGKVALRSSAYVAIAYGVFTILQQVWNLVYFVVDGELSPCIPILTGLQFNCGSIPIITASAAGNTSTTQVDPRDPNYISGPGGFGTNNFIPGSARLPYIIGFENQSNASAPAQQVVITENLDSNLDGSTFQLGDFGFGKIAVQVPGGQQSYKTRVDMTASRGVFVDVTAALTGNVVTWTFTSIDPATQLPPTDITVGFLPPDQTPPNGEGYVTYSVRPFSGLNPGSQIKAQAGVVFDTNASVATNLYINTIAPSTILCTGCYFLVNGVRATLAFNINATAGTGTFTYNYRTAAQTVEFTGATISQISVNGKTVTFTGQGSLNGVSGYVFQVTATDGGGPGSGLDTVSVAITGPSNYSYSASGTIVGGDVVINQ
jgi:RHS repeat-associated protein